MRPAQGLISQVKRLELYPNGHGKSQGVDQSFRFCSCTFAGHSATKLEDVLEGAQTYAELWLQQREIMKPKDS